MKERGIIFSAPMVRAILENRKTMTRRICKKASLPMKDEEPAFAVCAARESGWIAWFGIPDPEIEEFTKKAYAHGFPCLYGQPGDWLWVKETWCQPFAKSFNSNGCIYLADGPDYNSPASAKHQWSKGMKGTWKRSIFMPRWASRITLEITGIKVERLQAISEEDCLREGLKPYRRNPNLNINHGSNANASALMLQKDFMFLWDSINKKFPWSSNPWVWCISFKVLGK